MGWLWDWVLKWPYTWMSDLEERWHQKVNEMGPW